MKLCAKFFFLSVVVAAFIRSTLRNAMALYSPFHTALTFYPLSTLFVLLWAIFIFVHPNSFAHKHSHTQTHFKADRLENAINFFAMWMLSSEWSTDKKPFIHIIWHYCCYYSIVCCFCGMRTNATKQETSYKCFSSLSLLLSASTSSSFSSLSCIDWPEMYMQKERQTHAKSHVWFHLAHVHHFRRSLPSECCACVCVRWWAQNQNCGP